MATRRSLRFPIALAVTMILLLAGLVVGWVLMGVFGALSDSDSAGVYWTVLTLGSVFFAVLLAGVLLYLVWSIGMIRLHRRQTNFLDSVTHELKSPIASLKLCLQTLARDDMEPGEAADFRRYMIEDIERLDGMVDQVLSAARLEATRRPATEQRVDLPEVIAECAHAVCSRHQTPDELIRLELAPARITANRANLVLIFRNLIDNAVKYAGRPPAVTVSLNVEDGRRVVVRVADNGPGIPRKHRRRVFGRFARIGEELERERPGTGLGLYIVRRLVRDLGGRVRVCEDALGRGNVLEVRLPVGQDDDAAGQKEER
ncbi:MAG: Adaptive-response sensory-kinase SasA [Phycisphaerae bacterium]|nr:Adaptive-response sensory-kinase SasA [Phycisphaerae bacterium]